MTGEILHGGDLNLVVKIDDTVRRPIGPWSDAVEQEDGEVVCHDDLFWTKLCDAYGLDAGQRAGLIDEVVRRRQFGYEAHRLWGGVERRPGWREMWDAGSADTFAANMRRLEEHRAELERWLA